VVIKSSLPSDDIELKTSSLKAHCYGMVVLGRPGMGPGVAMFLSFWFLVLIALPTRNFQTRNKKQSNLGTAMLFHRDQRP